MSSCLKVLIAEDEYLNLMGLKSIVERLGHKVIGEADDGKKAIELASKLEPDLILMDINMPSIDGIEAIREINKDTIRPVIIISGYHNQELLDRANEVGVFAYLVKPVDERALQSAIEICLARFEDYSTLKKDYKNVKKTLEERKFIEKAKGILMDRHGLSEHDAMKALQNKSRDKNEKMVNVARKIIAADEILQI